MLAVHEPVEPPVALPAEPPRRAPARPRPAARPAPPPPPCGEGRAVEDRLRLRDAFPACEAALQQHRAADAPARATMPIVGRPMVPPNLLVRALPAAPVRVNVTLWPFVALGLSLARPPRVEDALLGWRWAQRTRGFGD